MKILHLSAVRNWGGGENHLENLCFELQKKEAVENAVFCVRGSVLQERLQTAEMQVFSAPMSNKLDPRFFLKLANLCRKSHFDLIHIHDSTALTHAVMADHFVELPQFILSKKTSFPIRTRRQTLFKYNYPKIKKILCVSEVTKQVSAQTLNGHERLEVIYHGTRMDNKCKKYHFCLRKKLQLSEDAFLIGNIANHIEAKDLQTFIKTVDELVNKKKLNDLHFVQVGKFSKMTAALQEHVRQLGLEKHISFLGFMPEAWNLIPQLNLSLLTSEIEGIPQFIYESFYHGIPVVSTRVGGIPEVIEHNKNGLLCDAYDHKGLAENILFLMKNPQLIPTFAEISRKNLEKRFTSEQMAGKTLAQYKKVLNGL
ncbi:MAG: glycosyltransferase family 4 protein [Salinimicrobium sp.]